MKRIESFCVNHDKLKKGMYVSRVDGDVITYDLRMKTPNMGDYLNNGAMLKGMHSTVIKVIASVRLFHSYIVSNYITINTRNIHTAL